MLFENVTNVLFKQKIILFSDFSDTLNMLFNNSKDNGLFFFFFNPREYLPKKEYFSITNKCMVSRF